MEKKFIPHIDLDSVEFQKKIITSLSKADGVMTVIPGMMGREKDVEMSNLLFLLANSKVSSRKICPACNGYHYYFVRDFDRDMEDKKGLCSACGSLMCLMAMFDYSEDDVKKWLVSKGSMNPFEMIKDGIDKYIKEGKIGVRKEPYPSKEDSK